MIRKLSIIIENEICIGCSKCINICPVNAIIGSKKLMHNVLLYKCIGCKLCLDFCPVDCIQLIIIKKQIN